MSSPVFVDVNVPIYATGRAHAYKAPCQEVLRLIAARPAAFVTDAEVLQELLHRYLSLGLWGAGRAVLEDFAAAMHGRVEPVHVEDVVEAGQLASSLPGAAARDLVHLAVMRRLGVTRIASADQDFDRVPGVQRLDPAAVDVWRRQLG